MVRLVQLQHAAEGRRVAVEEEPDLHYVHGCASVYELAQAAIGADRRMEHHHFKYPAPRRPGDAHLHFFGADHFSFRDKVRLEEGDVMVVAFEGFGQPLPNPLRIDRSQPELVAVQAL
jgi:hypothetical protein